MSLWWDQLPTPLTARPPLGEDLDVDVAIVGAGFTGLWTAYYLLRAEPGTRVAVLEQEVAGFGASGRNGGWCSALYPLAWPRLAAQTSAGAAEAMRRALQETVDEVGAVAQREAIDCNYSKGGSVVVARSQPQLQRAMADVAAQRAVGVGEADLRWLPAPEAEALVRAEGVLGGTFTPHCAALDPARLVTGLADAVARLGGRVFELSRVVDAPRPAGAGRAGRVRPEVRANGHRARADVVVRAVEAWAPQLPGPSRLRRAVLPVYSLMVATEPLGQDIWAEVGLSRRETFSDYRHLIIYGQRTADGRLAFGGRGAPYHFGSAVKAGYDRVPEVHRALEQTVREIFPALGGATFTHHWGGPLGVPRDWSPSVGFDRAGGVAWAGGYAGDGVSTSNLAGRTLADLLLFRRSQLTELPWVGHRSPAWEPEPLRWLGVNSALAATKLADRAEAKGRRPSPLVRVTQRLAGH